MPTATLELPPDTGREERVARLLAPPAEEPVPEPKKPESLGPTADESFQVRVDNLQDAYDRNEQARRSVFQAGQEQVQQAEERAAGARERVEPFARAVIGAASIPTPLPREPLPEPPVPSLKQRPFLATGEGKQAVTGIIAGLGTLAQMVAGITAKAPMAALSSLTGAMNGWAEGDHERAAREWREYLGHVDAITRQNEQAHRLWEAEMKTHGTNLLAAQAAYVAAADQAGMQEKAVAAARMNLNDYLGFLDKERAGIRDVASLTVQIENSRLQHEIKLATMERLSRDELRKEAEGRRKDAAEKLAEKKADETRRHNEAIEALRDKQLAVMAGALALRQREATGGLTDDLDIDVGARRLMRGDPPTAIVRGIGKAATAKFNAVQHRAAELWREDGLTEEQIADRLSRAMMTRAASNRALGKITEQEAQIIPFSRTAHDTLVRARELSDKIPRSGMPVVNRWILAGRKAVAGDPDVAAFDYHLRLGINEVAKITSSATGGGGVVSDTARREIEETLNRAMTPQQIRAVIDGAEFEMNSRIKHLEAQKRVLLGEESQIPTASGQGAPGGATMRIRKKGGGPLLEGPRGAVPDGYEEVK